MRFIMLIRVSAQSEADMVAGDRLLRAEMSRYYAELARAGALLDAAPLCPPSDGWRIPFGDSVPSTGGDRSPPTREPVVAYTVLQVTTREEAFEWTRRWSLSARLSGEIEVRRILEFDEPASAPRDESIRGASRPIPD